MDIIISNTAHSKISPFIKFIWEDQYQLEFKFIWEDQYQLEFVITIVWKSTAIYHLHQYKTGTKFLIVPSCHSLSHKNYVSCINFSSTVYIAIAIWTT